MTLSRRNLMILAGLGSAAMLLAAFAFQYIGGLAPCAMCIWARWPHVAAVAVGALGAVLPAAGVAGLGAIAMFGNTGISLYHTGVERDWWEGPASCTGGGSDLGSIDMSDLLNPDVGNGIVMCDEVAWEMFGLSMASWNGLGSLALAALWIIAARTRAAT